jgi:hypothetical protein
MKRIVRPSLAAAVALAFAGCASIKPATMVLPEGLAASSNEVVLRGLGGGREGQYTLAGNHGEFRRANDRLDVFDIISFDWGSSHVTVDGADVTAPVSAKCGLRQVTAGWQIVRFSAKPLAYECEYTGIDAGLSLQEAKSTQDALMNKARRRGEVRVDGMVLGLRSVHELEGTPLTLEAPIGYVVEDSGHAIGAIELNGSTPRVWLPMDDAATRRAVLLAVLPLAVLWDPAALHE